MQVSTGRCNMLPSNSAQKSMPYFHVLVTLPGKGLRLLSDLSEGDLKRQFLWPYRSAKPILSANEVIETKLIEKVTIIRTERPSADELKTIQDRSYVAVQEFNRSQDSAVLISAGRGYDPEDIVEAGTDVTGAYISFPPGEGEWPLISAVVNHPWISTIITGVIVAALAAYFG